MKKSILFISFLLALSASVKSQEKKLSSNINLLGAGYGIEYFVNSKTSLYSEFGLSYWGKINDEILDTDYNKNLAALTPYLLGSIRYYFVPIHPVKNENFRIGWRISTTYTGKFTFDNDLKSSGINSHQLGIFAGTSVQFLNRIYFEIELGPGYDFGNLYDYKFNLLGNAGLGFRF